MKNYYNTLCIIDNANNDQIKEAYRQLVKLCHPDKNPENKFACVMFRQVQEAYETLSDPVKRLVYNTELKKYQNTLLEDIPRQKKSKIIYSIIFDIDFSDPFNIYHKAFLKKLTPENGIIDFLFYTERSYLIVVNCSILAIDVTKFVKNVTNNKKFMTIEVNLNNYSGYLSQMVWEWLGKYKTQPITSS